MYSFPCLKNAIELCHEQFTTVQQNVSSYVDSSVNFLHELEQNVSLLVQRILRQQPEDIECSDSALLQAKSMEEYLEILARKVVSYSLQPGDTIAQPIMCEIPQYIVYKILEDYLGMRAVILVPALNWITPPLLLFRCTDGNNIHNILDDLREYPGELNFERNKERLRQILEEVSLEYGAFHVFGFSFGGALAQKTVANFPEYIERCTCINGLRPGRKTVELFLNKMKQFPQGMKKPEIWDLRHAKDIPSVLGGDALPITEGKSFTFGSISDSISYVEAHTILCQSNNLPVAIDMKCEASLLTTAQACENIRRAMGFFTTPLHNTFLQILQC